MGGNGMSRHETFYMLRYYIAMQQGKFKNATDEVSVQNLAA